MVFRYLLWKIGLPIIDKNQCIKFSSCTTLQKFYIKSQASQNNCDKNRFLVRGNTRKILAEFWHLFWLKMIVKIEIQRWPAEIPVNLLGQFSLSGQIFFSWAAAARNFEIFLSRPLFTIIFKPKMVSNLRKNFLCIVWHQKPSVKSMVTSTNCI